MAQKQISAEKAAELVFNLFQNHRWLLEPGTMSKHDMAYENDALQALLSLDEKTRWQNVSEPAARVACTLLTEFFALITFPNSPFWENRLFQVDSDQSETEQAFSIIAAEILRNHPHLKQTQ
ncbi:MULTISPECIES: hypothetical protein [unclassified Neisseria]|uniref:hypothetical protein n=1 Tax=unclassified Neisseria TaxID=2623750 RepID=UPI001071B7F3|nr:MULTISPECIES: hypothetical protein [unclassified Neisseria]MBF0802935.1 hypothetical protein [Neisseria sp. 19428wB4_WF04]TFU44464.1 hypothetical protein E4T99_00885 [Neisseria sp. WF04]